MGYNIKKHLTKVNKGSKGANKPEWIVFHFVGASGQAMANANYFHSVYRGASAHYFIDPSNIVQVVEDDTPAWHVGDGSRSSQGNFNGYKGYGATNNNAIGIELAQDTSTGANVWHWDFHKDTVKRAEWLIKQKQKQYNIPDERVIRHYDVSGKVCPGNWQYNNWSKWYAFKKQLAGVKGNALTGNTNNNDGKPTVSGKRHLVKTGETLYAIAKKYNTTVNKLVTLNDLEDPTLIFPETYLYIEEPKQPAPKTNLDKLVSETLAGKHGNGDARKRSLGSNFNAVQSRINELSGVKAQSAPKPKKSIDTLVKETLAGKHGNGDARKKSLGSNYDAVMRVINGQATIKPKGKSIDTLVKETLAGKHGNGDARKRSLGGNYNAVMAVINKKPVASAKPNLNKVVDDVIAGKYGNGDTRTKNLRKSGYNPEEIQKLVNKRY